MAFGDRFELARVLICPTVVTNVSLSEKYDLILVSNKLILEKNKNLTYQL